MTGKRTRYSAEFKARGALEALRGKLTTAQLAAEPAIHQTMVGEWKRQAVEGMVAVFSGRSTAQESGKAATAHQPSSLASARAWRRQEGLQNRPLGIVSDRFHSAVLRDYAERGWSGST